MRAVWKYQIMDPTGRQVGPIEMPFGATPLHVGVQGRFVCLWLEVNTTAPNEDREFFVVGTGHPIPVGSRHVGSTQDGDFVWHLYEVTS